MKVIYQGKEVGVFEGATFEVVNGDLVITPKEVEFIPKDGDICFNKNSSGDFIFIFKRYNHSFIKYVCYYFGLFNDLFSLINCQFNYAGNIRLATEEEKQKLLDALHKDGKDWDAENKKIVDYRWRAKFNEYYFYINDSDIKIIKTTEQNFNVDILRYKNGNYFQTEQQAEQALGKIKEILKTIK